MMNKYYDFKLLRDVKEGLVVCLSPETLAKECSQCSCPEAKRVKKNRYFLCIEVCGDSSFWIPFYTNSKCAIGKGELEGTWGSVRDQYYYPGQVWKASLKTIVLAAFDGGDISTPESRRYVSEEALKRVQEDCKYAVAKLVA